MSKFWNKVSKCEHKNISPNYYPLIRCGTPYCNAEEIHCLDCGVYISDCQCGSNIGLSGWSHRRWINFFRNKRNEKTN